MNKKSFSSVIISYFSQFLEAVDQDHAIVGSTTGK